MLAKMQIRRSKGDEFIKCKCERRLASSPFHEEHVQALALADLAEPNHSVSLSLK